MNSRTPSEPRAEASVSTLAFFRERLIAPGSFGECRYYLILAKDLGYRDTKEQMIVLEEISRFLEGYTPESLEFGPKAT